MCRQYQNLVGRTFDRWRVLSLAKRRPGRNRKWRCVCACGRRRDVDEYTLLAGLSRSCGCRSVELTNARNRKHGESNGHGKRGSPEYIAWRGMLSRCTNAKTPRYEDYGGRGIRVCKRWQTFVNFLADMGRRPSPRHSIDRVDNDGDYKPSNCRWVTLSQQANNKRWNRWITVDGETLTLRGWAARVGLHESSLHERLARGWDERRAVTTPPFKGPGRDVSGKRRG